MTTVFLTGFPGFLGSALVERLLDRYGTGDEIACLIQSKYRDEAESRVDELLSPAGTEAAETEPAIRLHEGDITAQGLGLDDETADRLQSDTAEVYHLAAVYDLGVSEDVGRAVNVRGTDHVLDFAEACPDIERFQYVSTCYVSGRYDGVFTEEMLREGQTFNNWYEATKFLAEVEVQKRMAEGLPATIYRPAIAVGDSRTGETQKYDGPYFVLQWLLRQPRLAVLPLPPGADEFEINVVPRDFVVDAIAHLSGLDESEGVVYQLADPNPPTVAEMSRLLADAADRRLVSVPTTRTIAKRSLESVPGVYRLMRIEPESVNYFTHPTRYTSGHTLRDLSGSGISCPPFGDYVETLVEFVRENPEIDSSAMV
ncbi:SDR family oxidoreductase [Salinirubrum litoreum]|uniref:SDR family oxidoreductase n=1 Tax=Salinirubrum litoreum TaxID=1126234 RepID=A0ABD5R8T2_9EURY|nr:SDR family oxidoreductase [Salinirubrum litoreum]